MLTGVMTHDNGFCDDCSRRPRSSGRDGDCGGEVVVMVRGW